MKKVAVLVLKRPFDSSLAITLDMLGTARRIQREYRDGRANVETVICGVGARRLRTGEGLSMTVDRSLDAVPDAGMVILPGLGVRDSTQIGRVLESPDVRRAVALLRRMHDGGATIAASCSATFLLAEAGLFDSQPATTSWWLADMFRSRFPHVELQTDRLLIAGDRLLCAGAAMAQADLMMAVIARLYGERIARRTGNVLLIDRRKFQSQYIMSGMVTHRHPEVAEAEHWIRTHMDRGFRIPELAAAVALSPRTLARRMEAATGLSPARFVQRLRVEHAIHLLETTSEPFETIAGNVGYANPSSLRALIRAHTGKRPGEFR